MASMNNRKKPLAPVKDTKTTINHEGSVVHSLNTLETLFSKVLGSFFGESTHYESKTAESDMLELAKLISSVPFEDKEYVLKIALLGREYNMIQYPLAVLTACFNNEMFKGDSFADRNGRNKLQYYSDRIIRRGKDITDVLALQINSYGFERTKIRGKSMRGLYDATFKRDLPLPIQLRKALKHKLETFNEYQLSKALGDSREVSMADVIKLIHPNAAKAKVRDTFFKEVIEGKVKYADNVKQVQSELANSRNTNTSSTIKDVKKSIDSSTVMAIVKNLVALNNAGALYDEAVVNTIVAKLTDKKQVQSSRLLPFRFYSAYKEFTRTSLYVRGNMQARKLANALIEALDLSIDNLQTIEGFSAIILDRSGSMQHPISGMSDVTADVVSALMGAICYKKGTGDIYLFADTAKRFDAVSSRASVMDITNAILHERISGGTYLDKALDLITGSQVKYDNMILFTDNDCYQSSGNTFKMYGNSYHYTRANQWDSMISDLIKTQKIKKFYLNNMLGNKFAIVNTDDYRKNLITGFSERVVDVINTYGSIGTGASDVRKIIDQLVVALQKK
jgi:hypothetical protein